MAKEKTLEEYRFLKPEEVDALILAKLASMPVKGGKATNKAYWTETELKYRHQVIIEYICQGLSNRRVKEEIMRRWKVTERSAQKYVSEALESLTQDNEEFIAKAREMQLERLNALMESLLERGDSSNAIKVLDQINKINGLYSEKKELDISGDIRFTFDGNEGDKDEE